MKPYFESLEQRDIEWSLSEDAYFKDNYNLMSWDIDITQDYEDALEILLKKGTKNNSK